MTTELARQVLNADIGVTPGERFVLMGVAFDSDADGICRRLQIDFIAHRAEVTVDQVAEIIRKMEIRRLVCTVTGGIKITLPG